MVSQRPLPVPPYPGVLPYRMDSSDDIQVAPTPHQLTVDHGPVSVGSFGPSSGLTLPGGGGGQVDMTDEQVRDKYYRYWEKQQARGTWAPTTTELSNRVEMPESQRGSQAVLLSTKEEKSQWSRGSDFLGAVCGFTLSLHSLWCLPMSIIQYGGVTFLIIYGAMLFAMGAPLLLLEMSLGQYSSLAPAQMFKHLCPLLTGLGWAMAVFAAVRAMLDLAVIMWAAQALCHLFSQQNIPEKFFHENVLSMRDATLEKPGEVVGELVIALSASCVVIFILGAAGTKTVGKVSLAIVTICFMLLAALTIRACLAPGAPSAVLTLLTPNWDVLTQPSVWLQAAQQLVFALQLGLGAISTYSSYNPFLHNIVRDCFLVVIAHLVWIILATILTCSLLGAAYNAKSFHLTSDLSLPSIVGHGVWLISVTLVEKSLATLSTGWLWAGLFFILILLVSVTSVFGYIEVITNNLVSLRPSFLPYKPAIAFLSLVLLFLLDLLLTTRGGIHVYHLLFKFIYNYPSIVFCLLTILSTICCHGTQRLMKNLSMMSKLSFPYWVSCHLSVAYTSVLPILFSVLLVFSASRIHLTESLSNFGIILPHWGAPLGWALLLLPFLPLLAGALFYIFWGAEGVPKVAHFMNCLKSTEQWTRNEKLELELDGDERGWGRRRENVSTA